jgi:hypothetical protein
VNLREDPFMVWLVSHLFSTHGLSLHAQDGKHVSYLEGFHDGLHREMGDTANHGGYDEARLAHRRFIEEAIGVPVRDD